LKSRKVWEKVRRRAKVNEPQKRREATKNRKRSRGRWTEIPHDSPKWKRGDDEVKGRENCEDQRTFSWDTKLEQH